jgi:hypothetical protein
MEIAELLTGIIACLGFIISIWNSYINNNQKRKKLVNVILRYYVYDHNDKRDRFLILFRILIVNPSSSARTIFEVRTNLTEQNSIKKLDCDIRYNLDQDRVTYQLEPNGKRVDLGVPGSEVLDDAIDIPPYHSKLIWIVESFGKNSEEPIDSTMQYEIFFLNETKQVISKSKVTLTPSDISEGKSRSFR